MLLKIKNQKCNVIRVNFIQIMKNLKLEENHSLEDCIEFLLKMIILREEISNKALQKELQTNNKQLVE